MTEGRTEAKEEWRLVGKKTKNHIGNGITDGGGEGKKRRINEGRFTISLLTHRAKHRGY